MQVQGPAAGWFGEGSVEDIVVANDHAGVIFSLPFPCAGETDHPLLFSCHKVRHIATHRVQGVQQEGQVHEERGVLRRRHQLGLGPAGNAGGIWQPKGGPVQAPKFALVDHHLLNAGQERGTVGQNRPPENSLLHEQGSSTLKRWQQGGRNPLGQAEENAFHQAAGVFGPLGEFLGLPIRPDPVGATDAGLGSFHHSLGQDLARKHGLPPDHQINGWPIVGSHCFEGQVDRIHIQLRQTVATVSLEVLLQPRGHQEDPRPVNGLRGRHQLSQQTAQDKRSQAKQVRRRRDLSLANHKRSQIAPHSCQDPAEAKGPPNPPAAIQVGHVVGQEPQAPPTKGNRSGQGPAQDLSHQPGSRHSEGEIQTAPRSSQQGPAEHNPKGRHHAHGQQQPRQEVAHPAKPNHQADAGKQPLDQARLGAWSGNRQGPGTKGCSAHPTLEPGGKNSGLCQTQEGPTKEQQEGPLPRSQFQL